MTGMPSLSASFTGGAASTAANQNQNRVTQAPVVTSIIGTSGAGDLNNILAGVSQLISTAGASTSQIASQTEGPAQPEQYSTVPGVGVPAAVSQSGTGLSTTTILLILGGGLLLVVFLKNRGKIAG